MLSSRELDDLDQPVELEQRLAGLPLELAPERERLLREPHVLILCVGEPEDPRAAVARPVRVPDLELLVDDRFVPAAFQRPSGREPHHAPADDRDLHARIVPIRLRRTPMPSTSSSTTSPGCSQRSSPCSRMQPRADRARAEHVARPQCGVAPRVRDDRLPRVVHVTEVPARALLAVHARDHLQPQVVELVRCDYDRPERRREVLPLRRPEPDLISARCRSRADQSFMIVKPPISPSAPIIAATSSS